MPETFAFGAEPSKEDLRTVKTTDLALGFPPPLTYKIDYTGQPHKNQKKIGLCTAAAVATLAEKFFGTGWVGSMEWLYKIGKVFIDGNTTEGSSAFTMLKAAQKYGIPSESKFPSNCDRTYAEFMQNTEITQAMLDDAALHKIPGYAQVPLNQTDLMQAIYQSRCGIIARHSLGNEWWTDINGNWTNDKAKLQPLRAPSVVISGHLVGHVGYDATGPYKHTIRNSWGDAWCDRGDIFFYLQTLVQHFTEAWTIVGVVLFMRDLRIGQTSEDVKRLQQFLNTHGFKVSDTGPGSPGQETLYFGLKTFNALKRLQTAKNIPNTGYFGPLTRAWVNKNL